jgi:CheY-like chemotaxis protein
VDKISPHPIRTVLLVDDNDDLRVLAKWFFDSVGYVVETARSAEDALSSFNSKVHDLVITDNSMPGMTGAELSHVIKMRSSSTPVVMYTANPPPDRSCIDILIQKPAGLLDVKDAIDKYLALRDLKNREVDQISH